MLETSAILLGITIIIEIISILFFRSNGKGSIFIAGYNLASEEERKKYDEKRMCKFIGKEFAILGIVFFIGAIIELFFVEKGFIFVSIVFIIWFIHHAYIRYKKFDKMFRND